MEKIKFVYAIIDLRIDLVCEEPSARIYDFLKNWKEITNPLIPKDKEKITDSMSDLKNSIFSAYYYSARNPMMAALLHMYNLYGEKGIFEISLFKDKSHSSENQLIIIPYINRPSKIFGSIFAIYCQKIEEDNLQAIINLERDYK